MRNTSTGVEKTADCIKPGRDAWKHLHGRGEDTTGRERLITTLETPPRAWRRLN